MSENIKLQLKQFIKAKRSQVFDAWTKPELLTNPSASSDLKVGGKYHIEMKGQMDGEPVNQTASGEYTKIIPNELISLIGVVMSLTRLRNFYQVQDSK